MWELPADFSYSSKIIGLGEIGLVRSSASDWTEHSRPYAQILMPLGKGHCQLSWRISSDEKLQLVHLEKGSIGFIAPHVLQSGTWLHRSEFISCLARESLIDRTIAARSPPRVQVVNLTHFSGADPCILLLIELCSQISRRPRPSEYRLIEELARSIVDRLLRLHLHPEVASDKRETLFTSNQKTKILSFINETVEDPKRGLPAVKDLAQVVGLSPLHFSRVFKNTMEVSPKRYLNTCVMTRAAALVKSDEHRVEEIATLVGYSDPSYFSRVFRRFFKMSPKDYRELHRK